MQNKSPSVKKDVGSDDATHNMHLQQPQIGMALIPETPVDFAALYPSNGWMTAVPTTNDFQVYAVTELPETPVLNLETLSGKSKSGSTTSRASKGVPRMPELPSPTLNVEEPEVQQMDESVPLDQEQFALYFASPLPLSTEPALDLIITKKEEGSSDDENLATLKKLCSDLDEVCTRIAEFTSHMK